MPQIAFGQITTDEEILGQVCKIVSQVTGLGKSQVFETLEELEELFQSPPASRFVAVTPKQYGVDTSIVSGAGGMPVNAVLQIAVCQQLGTDQANRSTTFLRDQMNGILRLSRKAAKALHLWNGIIRDGESILRQPARLSPGGITFRSRKPKLGWGAAVFNIEVLYRVEE